MSAVRDVPLTTPPRAADSLLLNAGDLKVRSDLATREDSAKGMFFNGVLTATRDLLGPGAMEEVRAASGEKKFVDFFNYPITTFLKMSFASVILLQESVGSFDAGFLRLGKQATNDFLSTSVGKTLLLLAGKDPRRLLPTLPSAFKTCVSYGERKMHFTGPKRCTLSMQRDFMPHPYHEGVLLAVIEAMGVANVKVVGQRTGPVDADYDISWE